MAARYCVKCAAWRADLLRQVAHQSLSLFTESRLTVKDSAEGDLSPALSPLHSFAVSLRPRPGSAPAAAAADPSRPPYVAGCSQQPPANGNIAEHEFPAACSVFSSSFCQQVDSVLLQLVFPAVTGTCPPHVRVGACQFLGVLFFFLSV